MKPSQKLMNLRFKNGNLKLQFSPLDGVQHDLTSYENEEFRADWDNVDIHYPRRKAKRNIANKDIKKVSEVEITRTSDKSIEVFTRSEEFSFDNSEIPQWVKPDIPEVNSEDFIKETHPIAVTKTEEKDTKDNEKEAKKDSKEEVDEEKLRQKLLKIVEDATTKELKKHDEDVEALNLHIFQEHIWYPSTQTIERLRDDRYKKWTDKFNEFYDLDEQHLNLAKAKIDPKEVYSEELAANKAVWALMNAGPDAMSNMFDVFFVIDDISKEDDNTSRKAFSLGDNYSPIKEFSHPIILSSRIESIDVPTFQLGTTDIKFAGTLVTKASTSYSGSFKSSFKVRADASLFVCDAFGRLSGTDINKTSQIEKDIVEKVKEQNSNMDPCAPNFSFAEVPRTYSRRVFGKAVSLTGTLYTKLNIYIRRACINNPYGGKDNDYTNLYRKMMGTSAASTDESSEEESALSNCNSIFLDDWIVFEDVRMLGSGDAISFNRSGASTASPSFNFIFKRVKRVKSLK